MQDNSLVILDMGKHMLNYLMSIITRIHTWFYPFAIVMIIAINGCSARNDREESGSILSLTKPIELYVSQSSISIEDGQYHMLVPALASVRISLVSENEVSVSCEYVWGTEATEDYYLGVLVPDVSYIIKGNAISFGEGCYDGEVAFERGNYVQCEIAFSGELLQVDSGLDSRMVLSFNAEGQKKTIMIQHCEEHIEDACFEYNGIDVDPYSIGEERIINNLSESVSVTLAQYLTSKDGLSFLSFSLLPEEYSVHEISFDETIIPSRCEYIDLSFNDGRIVHITQDSNFFKAPFCKNFYVRKDYVSDGVLIGVKLIVREYIINSKSIALI